MHRRQFTHLCVGLASAPSILRSEDAPPVAGRKLDFRIGDGFETGESDLRAVLLSAGEAIWQHCPNTTWNVPGFYIFYHETSPITLFDHRFDGRIAIGLNARHTFWAQFAYQFAHEFCHALAGHANDWKQPWIKERKANHWLEESLCETASLFALRSMGETWKTKPPYANWKSFAEALTKYADERLAASAKTLPPEKSFHEWFTANEPAMRQNGTIREKNNVVAQALLPLFEAEPSGWEAITFLNLTKGNPDKTLRTHFDDWSSKSPEAQHPFIRKLAAKFFGETQK